MKEERKKPKLKKIKQETEKKKRKRACNVKGTD